MWALLCLILTHCEESHILYTLVNFGISQLVSDDPKESFLVYALFGGRGRGGVMRGIPPPTSWKIGHSLHLEKYPPHIIIFMLQPNKNFIFRCSHCSCTTFILYSYSVLTGHSYFEIRQCSIFRECYFLALKKVQMIKFTTLQISTTQ